MKILFVSASPVNKEIGTGNTFLNIMPSDMELASIYTRNGLPDKRISLAFCVNEKMIVKKLLGRIQTAGKIIDERYGSKKYIPEEEVNESIVRLAKKKRYTIMFWVQGLIWRTNVWKSKELEDFINKFRPDLIFTLFTNNIFLNRIILHILTISGAPLVLYAWDNNYQWNKYQRSPLRWINQYFERIYMRKVINKARKLYVISDIQKMDYEQIFGKKCTVLTKGYNFSEQVPIKSSHNMPIQLLYTGNLGNNRWKTLSMIVNVLENMNRREIKGQLRIYTATPLTDEMVKALNKGCSSLIMGSVPADEIPEIQRRADILVHVEAFDRKNKFTVSQSFSTKIVDYLANASCILAVGPKDIASIDYFIRNDAGMVAESEMEIQACLQKVFDNPQLLMEYGKKAFASGQRNHDREKIEKMLKRDFGEIVSGAVR